MKDRDDLIGFALRAETPGDLAPDEQIEFDAIRRHLAFHDAVEEITPTPRLSDAVREEARRKTARGPALRRFWVPLAAAALVLVALFAPTPENPAPPAATTLHGNLVATGGGYTAQGVTRVATGGVTVTLDDGATVTSLDSQRLALRAGRIFLEVAPEGRGFVVEAGALVVETKGTAFLVERRQDGGAYVWVESGTTSCRRGGETRTVAAGAVWPDDASAPRPPSPRSFFQQPTVTANLLAPDRVKIVFRNDMPDRIQLAPPTGGEPLFYANLEGRSVPLSPAHLARPIALDPGAERAFELRLPRAAPDGEPILVSCPALGLPPVEARR